MIATAKTFDAAVTDKFKASKKRVSLTAFFGKLWAQPDLMERFSSGRPGRDEVVAKFNLSAADKKLVADGCVRDIIGELAGAKTSSEASSVLTTDENGSVDCGHAECKAFVSTLRHKK